ncbi:hypothetical protein ABPG74_017740 [Tetrahymena malaccensis]
MDLIQINSGFKYLDIFLKKRYFDSLWSAQDDMLVEDRQDAEQIQKLFRPAMTNHIEEMPRAQSASQRISFLDEKKVGLANQKQDSISPQTLPKLHSFKSKKFFESLQSRSNINDQLELIDQTVHFDNDVENINSNGEISQIPIQSSKTYKSRLQNEIFFPRFSLNTPENTQNKIKSSDKPFKTLKFNDIVYLKFKQENKKENERQSVRSYLVITNTKNQLECVSEQVQSLDNPVANFRRCLFQILNPRQSLEIQKLNAITSVQSTSSNQKKSIYGNLKQINSSQQIYSQQIETQKYQSALNGDKLQTQQNQLNEEDNGDLLVYGKQVLLYHQYSKMFLTFNPQKPAKQNGCIQCTLEKYPNSFSVFRMLPNDYSRRLGDKIFDSDVINIQEIKKGLFFLNVQVTNKIQKESVLSNQIVQSSVSQIYASEESSKFKVKCYLGSEYIEQNNDLPEDGIAFKTGDIIKIKHLDSGAFLSVSEKKFTKYSLTCKVQNSQDEQQQSGHGDNLVIRGLEQNKMYSPDNFQLLYELENPNSSYCHWEIQRSDHYKGGELFSDECFRLKNLATGLFLTQDQLRMGKLSLTYNGKEEDCYFYIKKDKTTNEMKKIYQQDTFKIYNYERKYVAANLIEKGKLEISIQKKISGVSIPYLHAFITTEKQVVEFIEQSLQIYNILLQFHFYLQNFAITLDKSKKQTNEKISEDVISFSYQEASLQQKSLEMEQQQVQKSLTELENLLMKDSTDSQFTVQMKQQILKEQKILELLILLARLIDVMSHGSKSTQGSKDKFKFIRNIRNVSDKSPLFIVNKHLQQLPVKIYNILLLGSKQNSSWSSYIFDNDDLFSGQLRYYPKEVGALLKEAVKNVENFKNENTQGEEIAEWVRLLEPLDDTKSNISDQIFFVEFICLAIIDPQQRPIQIYQNKCCSELLSKKDGRPIIQLHDSSNANGVNISFFYSQRPEDIQANNKSLEDLGIEGNKGDRITFSLEKMSKDSIDKDKNLLQYIRYISSALNLLANLCRGRNKNSIILIKDSLGINENHIFNALRSSDMHISIKTSFLQLFEVLFLDDEPHLSLARSENRNYVWEQIEKKNVTSKTAEIFKQIQQEQEDYVQNVKPFDQRILQILVDLWENGLPDIEYSFAVNFQNMTQKQKQEREEKGRYQLQFLITVMKVTRTAMDLGQFTTEKIEFITNQVIQSLSAFVGFSVQKSLYQQDHWIKKFINKIVVFGDFDQELEQIIIEVSNIIRLYLRIKLNLQINALLKIFYQEYTSMKGKKSQKELQELYQQVILNFVINNKNAQITQTKDIKKKKTDVLNITAPAVLNRVDDAVLPLNKQDGGSAGNGENIGSFNILSDHNNNLQNKIAILEQKTIFERKELFQEDERLNASKIENMILIFLLSKEKLHFNQAYDHMTETLKQAINHVEIFFRELKNVELFYGEDENNLYRLFEIGSETQLISFFKLENLIDTLLFEESSKNKGQKNETVSTLINKYIQIINDEFKVMHVNENHILFQKFQNIIRNLRIHKSISKLLILNPQFYQSTLECVIRFLINFSKNNEFNQKELLYRFDDLLNLINYEVGAEILLGIILQSVCQREHEFKPYLQSIFQKLNSPFSTKSGQTHIFEMLLSVLKKQVSIQHSQSSDPIKLQKKINCQAELIPENQQKILNLILQISPVQLFIESHKHFNDFQSKSKTKQELYQDIYMYKSLMKLLSTLSEKNQLSIVQCQRIMIYEDMKQFLLSQQTPYIIKQETFKVLLQIYIQQTEESNLNLSIQEMNEILQHVILKDLTQFSKYIEGLVYVGQHSLESEQALQAKIKEYTKEFFEDKTLNVDKPNQLGFASKVTQQKEENNVDIIDSPIEYWNYLYSGHNWNLTKDGLLQIILDCYYEINKRGWINFEANEEETPTTEQDVLTDQLLLIKLVCQNIRCILKKIQNQFDIDLSQLIYMLSECIMKNKVKKEFNNLKNIKQVQLSISGMQQKLFDTISEDFESYVKNFEEVKMIQIVEQLRKHPKLYDRFQKFDQVPKEPSKEFVYRQERQTQRQAPLHQQLIKQRYLESIQIQKNSILTLILFYDKLKFLIERKFLTLNQIYKAFGAQQVAKEQNQPIIELDRYSNTAIKKEDFIIKFVNLLTDISLYGIKDANLINYDDLNFFFDAFAIIYPQYKDTYDIQIQKKSKGNTTQREITQLQLNLQGSFIIKKDIEKLHFLSKFTKYIQKNYHTSNKSHDQIVLLSFEKSFKQFESFKYFINVFKQVSLQSVKEKSYSTFANNILNEIIMCNESDQRRKSKVFFEQLVALLKKKDHQYFLILMNFIEELAAQQNQSFTSSYAQQKTLSLIQYQIQQMDIFGNQSVSKNKEIRKLFHPSKYVRVSQNLIWNQKLYFQVLLTISDIFIENQTLFNANKWIQPNQQETQIFQESSNNSSLYQQVKALLIRKKENTKIVLYCMKILNGLYSLNLKHSHAQLLSILKKPRNIKITRNFLSFIKNSFSNYLQQIEQIQNQDINQQLFYKEKKEELQLQEEIVLQILKVIENSCEHCNEEFQNFFRIQNIESSQSYVHLNIVREILYFFTNFTKHKSSYFYSFSSKSSQRNVSQQKKLNIRYYLLLNQCISTLKNLCNGTSPKNKDLLLNNTNFLIQLNSIITESNLDLQSENLNDIRALQTVSNCVDLLLTIIVCSQDQNSLMRLISIMNMENIIKLLNFIYHFKIKSRLYIIQQEQQCTHQNTFNCSASVCYKKFMTFHDHLIMRLAFNFVIALELILDNINEDDMNLKLRMQEENTLLLSIFIEMKKKDDFTDIYNKVKLNNEENSLENKQSLEKKRSNDSRQSKIYDSKKSQIFKSRTYKKFTSAKKSMTLHNILYNEIKEDDSSKQDEIDNYQQEQLAEDMGLQRESRITTKFYQLKRERALLRESLSFYMQFVGSVEIVKDKSISKLFFRIPLLSSYLTHSIRKNLINKAVDLSDKNRLKLLVRYTDYFQQEMRFCQNLSKYQLIIFAVEYRSYLINILFVLVLIINLIFLFKLTIVDTSYNLSGQGEVVYTIIRLIHLILTILNMIIVTIERYPVVTYQNYIEIKQKYRGNIMQKILKYPYTAFAFDFDFIYYLIYLVLTFCSLGNIIIYSVLLVDIIKQSVDLSQILLIFSLNFRKLFKTAILCFLIIFIYSLIGSLSFTQNFTKSNVMGQVDINSSIEFYDLFTITLQEGLLNPQGISQALVIPGTQNSKYWGRFFYDISFWLLVNFLFLNLMLGQIIDSYSEYRNLQKKYDKNIKRKCFICGLTVEDLEAKTLDWDNHIKYEHNLNNYLNYILYIKSKTLDECDGIEKYVKECISKEQTDFFPQRNTLTIERLNKKIE